MAAASRGCSRLRLPRPKTFLGLMSLQTGTELLSLLLVFNKATGIYGIFTLLTGFVPSALQVSLYILEVLMVATLAYLIPHIRKQSPFHNLALAWLYVIDSAVNAAYTTAFATIWYLANFHDARGPAGAEAGPTTERDEPEFDDIAPVDTGSIAVAAASGVNDSVASMVLIIGFTLMRIYFTLVIMAYARTILRCCIRTDDSGDVSDEIGKGRETNPFAEGAILGDGLKGKLGRIMVSVGRGYWLGSHIEDEEWAKDTGSKFPSRRMEV
ncbi:Inositolphosphorylceramide synthase subunit Kei1-domain-containing protein [Lasiosphaeria hispida]|uniref:Inositolphosphorylceramide synthase subunit Kei1-domain-containing protein n=1 Tax=Lasiosphaeria hispida TaxID=260671 RepID=A0AAJ0HJE2_9PEZI|nr:Inositolphosphorylceramide synthase subunit Kei1-domain-containing protein [Lasiosphaeria hispida]